MSLVHSAILGMCVCVCVTFMVGGAVRGGEGGQSAMGTLEMVRSSCLLRIKAKNLNNNESSISQSSLITTVIHKHYSPFLTEKATLAYQLCHHPVLLLLFYYYTNRAFLNSFSVSNHANELAELFVRTPFANMFRTRTLLS